MLKYPTESRAKAGSEAGKGHILSPSCCKAENVGEKAKAKQKLQGKETQAKSKHCRRSALKKKKRITKVIKIGGTAENSS